MSTSIRKKGSKYDDGMPFGANRVATSSALMPSPVRLFFQFCLVTFILLVQSGCHAIKSVGTIFLRTNVPTMSKADSQSIIYVPHKSHVLSIEIPIENSTSLSDTELYYDRDNWPSITYYAIDNIAYMDVLFLDVEDEDRNRLIEINFATGASKVVRSQINPIWLQEYQFSQPEQFQIWRNEQDLRMENYQQDKLAYMNHFGKVLQFNSCSQTGKYLERFPTHPLVASWFTCEDTTTWKGKIWSLDGTADGWFKPTVWKWNSQEYSQGYTTQSFRGQPLFRCINYISQNNFKVTRDGLKALYIERQPRKPWIIHNLDLSKLWATVEKYPQPTLEMIQLKHENDGILTIGNKIIPPWEAEARQLGLIP